MGFSFRSLYTDDDQPAQAGSANLLQRGASERRTRPVPPAKAKEATSASFRSGIPGPLTAQSPDQVALTATPACSGQEVEFQSDEAVVYALDSLEPEPSARESVGKSSQLDSLDELEPFVSTETDSSNGSPGSNPSVDGQRDAEIQLRAVFSVTEPFTLESIVALTARLPGITSCLIQNSDRALLASAESGSVQTVELAPNSPSPEFLQSGLTLLGLDQSDGVLLRSGSSSVSCFSCVGLSLMARHPDENPQPGLWEKLLLITQAAAKIKSGI